MIYAHRAEIVVEIAILDLSAIEINQLADDMIEQLQPPWNMPTNQLRR